VLSKARGGERADERARDERVKKKKKRSLVVRSRTRTIDEHRRTDGNHGSGGGGDATPACDAATPNVARALFAAFSRAGTRHPPSSLSLAVVVLHTRRGRKGSLPLAGVGVRAHHLPPPTYVRHVIELGAPWWLPSVSRDGAKLSR